MFMTRYTRGERADSDQPARGQYSTAGLASSIASGRAVHLRFFLVAVRGTTWHLHQHTGSLSLSLSLLAFALAHRLLQAHHHARAYSYSP